MCWWKRSSRHRRPKKPASSARHGSPRTACFRPAPIRANAGNARAASVHPVSGRPAASWNVQAARAMVTGPLTGTARRAVTETGLTHHGLTVLLVTVHHVAMAIGPLHHARTVPLVTVHHVAMGIGPLHHARIAPQEIARRVGMGIGLRAAVVRHSNRVAAANRLAADRRAEVGHLVAAGPRVVADPLAIVLRAARAHRGASLKPGDATCGLSPDVSKAVP